MTSRRRLFRMPWRTKGQIGADIDEELRFHLDARAEELERDGHSPTAARAQALREFGDIEDARRYIETVDRHTEAATRRSEYMSDFLDDLTYALRKLRGAPGFAVTAIFTLALGIGANTAIFSLVNGVLLRPLDFPQPDRIVRLRYTDGGQGDAGSPPDLGDYRARATQSFESFALMENAAINLVRPGVEPERLTGARVSANWFNILRAKPLLGRTFAEGEDQEGTEKTTILSEALWRSRFNADSSVVGTSIRLNGEPYRVLGVMPAKLGYPLTAQIWTPLVLTARQKSDDNRGARYLAMLARIKEGVSLESATNEMSRVTSQLNTAFPNDYNKRTATPVPLQEWLVGDIKKPLWVVMGAVAFVLLIACANVANLLLVRATARESELAIRTALGAAGGRLVRQLMTESLVLTTLGAIAGLVIARLGMAALIKIAPAGLPQVAFAKIDATTLAVTALIAVATGIIFGVLPSKQVSHGSLATTLRAGSRGTRSRPGALKLRGAIVVTEVAMAVMLLAGAGLLIRSFGKLLSVETGFDPERVMTYNITLPGSTYRELASLRAFVDRQTGELSAIPGVSKAAISTDLPLDGRNFVISFTIRGKPEPKPNEVPAARIVSVTPDYFATLGMKLSTGRAFTSEDRFGAPQVAIVNREFLRKHLPNEDPLGKYVELGWGQDSMRMGGTIVGVVGDVKQSGLDEQPDPTIYLPYSQAPRSGLSIAVRTTGPSTAIAGALREQMRSVDKDLPVYNLRQLKEIVALSVASQRFYMTLLASFAGVALLLAAVGLYGVISYAVGQRTHELGIRVALGATAERITRMVIREGLALTVMGIGIGLVAAIGLSRVLQSLLFGIEPRDPLTLAVVAVLLTGVAMLASFIPARRAAKADPLVAMRGD